MDGTGMDIPSTDTPLLHFDLESPDQAVYQKLPALYRKLIEGRVNAEAPVSEETPAEDVSW